MDKAPAMVLKRQVAPVVDVAVCIATFKRPQGLARLLDSVAALDRPIGANVSVLVCDNDPDRSAYERYSAQPPAMPFEFRIIHQPERGVASVRNALVGAALERGCDAIAFVDDDEEVPPRWLANLVEIQHRAGVAIVTGPVLSVFEAPPPAWLNELGYFDAIDRPDGELATFAISGNVLLHLSVLESGKQPFDPRLNLTGGEDTHFFRRCILAGHEILWNVQAVPSEHVPSSRMTPQWMRQREYRRGTTRSFVLRDVEDGWARRVKRVAAVYAEYGRAGMDVLRSLVERDGARRKALLIRAVNQAAYGTGMLAGLFGASYSEYRTTHGS